MERIEVDLKNCYGIGSLSAVFDFSQHSVHAVYAPNGFMKSSFARTMADIASGSASADLMFPGRTTERSVRDEAGEQVEPAQVLVIPPYQEAFQAEGVSSLLVDAALKASYDQAAVRLNRAMTAFLKQLRAQSKLRGKTKPEDEILRAFGSSRILPALRELVEAGSTPGPAFSTIDYKIVFDPKVEKFLSETSTLGQLQEYVDLYDQVVAGSHILTQRFTHTHALSLHKTLMSSDFFGAKHKLLLHADGEGLEVQNHEQFKACVEKEIERVFQEPALRAAFDQLDKRMSVNAQVRKLRDYLRDNPWVTVHLLNHDELRRQFWRSTVGVLRSEVEDLLEVYDECRSDMESAVLAARQQATDWAAVVALFNDRFTVPFRVSVANQADVILKEVAPQLAFEFLDEDETVAVESDTELLRVLSQGERRALYLLNILFEIRVREKAGGDCLVVVDDIADSFDYRNKYAIIEYLQDVARTGTFRLIILSHNYDFHRGAAKRLGLPWVNRRIAGRVGRNVSLGAEKYQRSPLVAWLGKPNDVEMYLAAIPFVRNLAGYCGYSAEEELLTLPLHIKPGSESLTLEHVDQAFATVIRGFTTPSSPCRTKSVLEVLREAADRIASGNTLSADLESKVVLCMAIRLEAERHMIARLVALQPLPEIKANQTSKLLSLYRDAFPDAAIELAVLSRVQLATPGGIHLNSFMFEPILDLGIGYLRDLYRDATALA